jgi:hypothetical protein
MLKNFAKQLLIGFHHINGNFVRLSIPQARHDLVVLCFQVGKSSQQRFDGFFVVLGCNDDVNVFGGSGLFYPTAKSVGANEDETHARSLEDGNDLRGRNRVHHLETR